MGGCRGSSGPPARSMLAVVIAVAVGLSRPTAGVTAGHASLSTVGGAHLSSRHTLHARETVATENPSKGARDSGAAAGARASSSTAAAAHRMVRGSMHDHGRTQARDKAGPGSVSVAEPHPVPAPVVQNRHGTTAPGTDHHAAVLPQPSIPPSSPQHSHEAAGVTPTAVAAAANNLHAAQLHHVDAHDAAAAKAASAEVKLGEHDHVAPHQHDDHVRNGHHEHDAGHVHSTAATSAATPSQHAEQVPGGHTVDDKGNQYLCPSGKYSKPGEKHCSDCPKGQWSDVGSASCNACPAGTFNDKEGQEGCTPCGQGKFGTAVGATSSNECRQCPPGAQCLESINSAAKPCAGPDCAATCSFMFQASAGGHGCTPKPVALAMVAGVVLVAVVGGSFYARRRIAQRAAGALDMCRSPTVLDYGTI